MEELELPVAVCEMTSIDCVETNLKVLLDQLEFAAANGARFVSFPENSLFLRVDMDHGEKYALEKNASAFAEVANLAAKKGVCVHLGSVPVHENGGIDNAAVMITPDGKIQFPYSKMHLFDIDLPGKKPMRESDYYKSGGEPAIFEFSGFRFALTICYDLRFAEFYSYYCEQNVDALLIPAAFLVETGRAHWEVLLRARAIESQCYVLAAAQEGLHVSHTGARRKTYGHSMVVDPWGEILGQVSSETEERVIFAQLSKTRINDIRQQVPMKSHRRLSANWSWQSK